MDSVINYWVSFSKLGSNVLRTFSNSFSLSFRENVPLYQNVDLFAFANNILIFIFVPKY